VKVIVLSGVSGSGKSTIAKALTADVVGAVTVSADSFFGDGPKYAQNFRIDLLGEAHNACFRSFMDALLTKAPLVVVDNTNSREVEIAPYMLAASAYGYAAVVLRVACVPEVAVARNTHGVPREVILKMAKRLDALKLPPWWTVEVVSRD